MGMKNKAMRALFIIGILILAANFKAINNFAELLYSRWNTEDLTARYDSALGWENIPNIHYPDFYGPKKSFSTDSRGFRITKGVSKAPANLVCSGDSFTIGVGVSDEETWCAKLSSERMKTLNMGVSGYGIDQAYLKYKRDGMSIPHDFHVF